MELSPGGLVLIRVQVSNPDLKKITDKWEQSPYKVISKFDKLVFRVQEVGNESTVCTLHRNMLFSLMTEDQFAQEEVTIVIANLLMNHYFDPN